MVGEEEESELKTGYSRPVMIHRAILGSVERIIAMLCESYKGKWPFWLSPRQILIVSVRDENREYAEQLREVLFDLDYRVEMDVSDLTLAKKVVGSGRA